jgi:hypothetical protein
MTKHLHAVPDPPAVHPLVAQAVEQGHSPVITDELVLRRIAVLAGFHRTVKRAA